MRAKRKEGREQKEKGVSWLGAGRVWSMGLASGIDTDTMPFDSSVPDAQQRPTYYGTTYVLFRFSSQKEKDTPSTGTASLVFPFHI
jgi:hypothetical protein